MIECDISYILNQNDLFFPIKVLPKSPRPGLGGIRNGALVVRVCAPPEKGKANAEAEKALAAALKLAAFDVSVVSGASSRSKRIRVPPSAEASLRVVLHEAGALNISVSAR